MHDHACGSACCVVHACRMCVVVHGYERGVEAKETYYWGKRDLPLTHACDSAWVWMWYRMCSLFPSSRSFCSNLKLVSFQAPSLFLWFGAHVSKSLAVCKRKLSYNPRTKKTQAHAYSHAHTSSMYSLRRRLFSFFFIFLCAHLLNLSFAEMFMFLFTFLMCTPPRCILCEGALFPSACWAPLPNLPRAVCVCECLFWLV